MPSPALWSFASPWLLLWGAAAAIPVLIHLWSRRRYFETSWAATQFLLAAIRRHQRRLRIEQWLLLMIRTLILVLLALALAEPVISGFAGVSGMSRHPPIHTILVIDTSYSMAFEHDGTTRLARACSQAAKIVEDAAPGDAFTLVTLADPPEVIIGRPSTSHDAVLAEINRLTISNRVANLAATIGHIEHLASMAQDEFDRQQLHIFSDLGRNTWTDSPSNRYLARLTALSHKVICRLTDISEGVAAENVAITRLSILNERVTVSDPVAVEIEVENFSDRAQHRKRVALAVDGQQVGERFVDVEQQDQALARFSITFNVAGDHVLEATIGDDGLKLDNARWLSVPVRTATRVLCIPGRPHAADYVALALQPDREAGAIQAEVASEHAILERDLNEYECVFLCNIARLTAEEAKRLRQYVELGGGVVFTLGDVVEADAYNRQLGKDSQNSLLPARLNEVISDGEHSFDALEYQHPLTELFRGHERSGLLTVPVWRYLRLDELEDSAVTALAFDNGDPAIIEAAVGQGRVLLVATAVSPESMDRTTSPPIPWTALASWPSFPPLMHEIVHFVESDRVARRNLTIGDPLVLPIPTKLANAAGTLTLPNRREIRMLTQNTERAWTYSETDQPGIYRLVTDGPMTTPATFAVNLPTLESNLEAVSPSSLADVFDKGGQLDITSTGAQQRDIPLFRLALGSVLLLLITETVLAGHFGRSYR
ncbi:MAG: BatA domain-containing protein [Planctomycetaceae bacterium]|nr:BatA domain-containing protein [Planctomycetales bacterium]MCB9927258.1 BatA domain-containing protein [Planctomycetaceae bacterium]